MIAVRVADNRKIGRDGSVAVEKDEGMLYELPSCKDRER
jgi:hypothetical protein